MYHILYFRMYFIRLSFSIQELIIKIIVSVDS